jgi:peroxiredoxin Q/BCP
MLKTGQRAPLFSLPDSDMVRVDLARYRGKKNVVLYFYPRDGTPACTLQAGDFSDHEDEFARHDCVVLGVSPDDCLCHAEFRDANGVSIVLLADTECVVCKKYGVLQAEDVATDVTNATNATNAAAAGGQGRNGDRGDDGPNHRRTDVRHITRATFVIDKRGVVRHALYNVSPRGHAMQVLDLVKALE